MRQRTKAIAILLGFIVVSFLVFAPVVPQPWTIPGCTFLPCPSDSQPLVFHYYSSVAFYYFKIGGIYGACGGYYVWYGQFGTQFCT
jgi:hypothetical protein